MQPKNKSKTQTNKCNGKKIGIYNKWWCEAKKDFIKIIKKIWEKDRFRCKNPPKFLYIKTMRKVERQTTGGNVYSICQLKAAYAYFVLTNQIKRQIL